MNQKQDLLQLKQWSNSFSETREIWTKWQRVRTYNGPQTSTKWRDVCYTQTHLQFLTRKHLHWPWKMIQTSISVFKPWQTMWVQRMPWVHKKLVRVEVMTSTKRDRRCPPENLDGETPEDQPEVDWVSAFLQKHRSSQMMTSWRSMSRASLTREEPKWSNRLCTWGSYTETVKCCEKMKYAEAMTGRNNSHNKQNNRKTGQHAEADSASGDNNTGALLHAKTSQRGREKRQECHISFAKFRQKQWMRSPCQCYRPNNGRVPRF